MEPQWHNFKNGTYDLFGRWHDCPDFGTPIECEDLVIVIAMNGTKHLRWGCYACHGLHSKDIKHRDTELDCLPVVRDMRKEVCRRCGAMEAEYHHWAPSYKFADSSNWPGDYLCRTCHRFWHVVMDPDIYTGSSK